MRPGILLHRFSRPSSCLELPGLLSTRRAACEGNIAVARSGCIGMPAKCLLLYLPETVLLNVARGGGGHTRLCILVEVTGAMAGRQPGILHFQTQFPPLAADGSYNRLQSHGSLITRLLYR